MRIAEIFHSIQGEGRFSGTPSVFVRTTGCNLRCWFCDTEYTSWRPEGFHETWQSVLERVKRFDCEHVVVTGGEPMLQPDVVPLTHALAELGKFVTVETAGTVYRPVQADLMSISPKLANSTPQSGRWSARHERLRDNPDVVRRLIDEYSYQLKFVIDRREDVDDVQNYLTRFENVTADRVWLMPQCVAAKQLADKTEWLKPDADKRGYRFSGRLHIELYGNARGT